MSNIGKKTIFFSPFVQIKSNKSKNFLLIGDKSTMQALKINIPLKLTILKKNEKWNQISLSLPATNKPQSARSKDFKSLWGTLRALLAKTISGFYKKHAIKLKFIGVGFKAHLKKNLLILRLGFSHKLFCQIPNTVTITKIKKRPIIFLLQSHFLEIVKTTAFRLRSFKKPEPYKGKGILFINENLKLKESKKASK
jgi:large subunit ribosomal protein L6